MTIDIYDSGGDTFRTRLFGFDKNEVRACVRNLVHDHDDAQRQVERLTARLRTLEESREDGATHEAVATQLEKVLASACKITEDLKHEAEAAAGKILNDAQDEAVRLRGQAEADAAALAASATARVTALESEIEQMTARRDSLQAQLDGIATTLDALSRQMRSVGERRVDSPTTRTVLDIARV